MEIAKNLLLQFSKSFTTAEKTTEKFENIRINS